MNIPSLLSKECCWIAQIFWTRMLFASILAMHQRLEFCTFIQLFSRRRCIVTHALSTNTWMTRERSMFQVTTGMTLHLFVEYCN
jgi:hypothetical protein